MKSLLQACVIVLALASGSLLSGEQAPLPADYCSWDVQNFSIEQPLCGLQGDPEQGRRIVVDSHGGNCLACHRMPIPEESLHGTVGPPLDGLAGRMRAGQMRLHVVDQRQFNPMTIMPGFYRDPRLANRVADAFFGKTFLSAQQVEDVVAYLETLQ